MPEDYAFHILEIRKTMHSVLSLYIYIYIPYWMLWEDLISSGQPGMGRDPTLGVANLLLVDFIVCFGPVVPLENHVKTPWQNAGITGGSLGGLGHRLGNFACLFM